MFMVNLLHYNMDTENYSQGKLADHGTGEQETFLG